MNVPLSTNLTRFLFAVSAAMALLLSAFAWNADPAAAAPKKCFGKKVNRVISGNGKKVKLKFRDVTWIKGDRVTVIAKPYSRICSDEGRQYVHAGKGRTFTSTGADDDRVYLHNSSNKNEVQAGLGSDLIVGSKGHDFLYGSPKSNPGGAPDSDVIYGVGGNDRIFDFSGEGNRLNGQNGSDRIYSLGDAVSEIHGGSGTDFLYSNGGRTDGGVLEKVFGEQGNDRLRGDQPNNNGPAYFDGGEGDDWVYGTPADDTIIFHSGIKKIYAGEGDDLVVSTSRGRATVDGGSGNDTISYAAHTPPGGRKITGVDIDLSAGTSLGYSRYALSGLENVIGSPFDDRIKGDNGKFNVIDGGLGDDEMIGQERDRDEGDGGLGTNECEGFAKTSRCNRESPGDLGGNVPLVDINEGGILTVMGSRRADEISVGYDPAANQYRVSVPGRGIPSGLCTGANQELNVINCPADANSLNGMLIYGNDGDDRISLQNSIPSTMTTTINGGTGNNTINGGPSKDFISTDYGSAGSTIDGGDGLDVIYINDNVTARGGKGTDGIHVRNPCLGGSASGGDDTDSVIFAGADRGVKADIAGGYAEWKSGGCANRLSIGGDVEKLEGTAYDDHLIIGRRLAAQQGKSTLLGREGNNILDSKNGVRNTVTTGPAAHKNTVIADKKDKIVWGWGLAAF
ncbi:MAG TPA: calcium-binding protein [Solirubrobacterales bacterium]|nr:calcium-binding protein [Solirubrobacterales bacterium]